MFYEDAKTRLAETTRDPLLFASYDVSSKALVYEKPNALAYNPTETQDFVEFSNAAEAKRWSPDADRYDANEDSGSGQSHALSVLATPGHDMYVQLGHATPSDDSQVDWTSKDYTKVKADTIMDGAEHAAVRFLAHAANGIKGSSAADEPVSEATALPLIRELVHELGIAAEKQVNAFLELYGYWLSVGTIQDAGAANEVSAVTLTVRKPADQKWIEERLETLSLEMGEDVVGWHDEVVDQHHYQIKNPAWTGYFAGQSGADKTENTDGAKRLWSWVWSGAFQAGHARAILSGLRKAGGSEGSFTKSKSATIYTSSARFRDELQTLALHAGYSSSFRL
ncbi:hypothetical protein EC988_007779, partial [Linderina pennispora]